jgi:uncharacterized integral membrane protein
MMVVDLTIVAVLMDLVAAVVLEVLVLVEMHMNQERVVLEFGYHTFHLPSVIMDSLLVVERVV